MVGLWLPVVNTIRCFIALGQRGKLNEESVSWTRECPPSSRYCFEAVTSDIEQMMHLFDFQWDPYYAQFYVRSCGGDYGTPTDWRPFKGKPKIWKTKEGYVKVNITAPNLITGQGGLETLDLHYVCRKNLCSKASASRGQRGNAILALTAIAALWFYFAFT